MSKLHEDMLINCAEDDVGLWEFVWAANGGGYIEVSQQVRDKAISLVRDLLEAGPIQAQDYLEGRGWEIWQLPVDLALERINCEWDVLGHTPNLGDIAFFTATEKGRQKAREMLANRQ
jgi:hypothetical protein